MTDQEQSSSSHPEDRLLTKTRVHGIEFSRLNHSALNEVMKDINRPMKLSVEHVDLDLDALKFERPDLEKTLQDTRQRLREFLLRVDEKPKEAEPILKTNFLEQFLNDALRVVERQHEVHAIARPFSKTVLEHYQIDSYYLKEVGLTNEQVIGIYRSMYAHSYGVYSCLKDVTRWIKVHRDQQGLRDGERLAQSVQQNVWRCFLMLLEGASPSDYQLLTKQIDDMHMDIIVELKENEEKILHEYAHHNKEFKSIVKELREKAADLEERNQVLHDENTHLSAELAKFKALSEDQAKLILGFEDKVHKQTLQIQQGESKVQLVNEKLERLQFKADELAEEKAKFLKTMNGLALQKDQDDKEIKKKYIEVYGVNQQLDIEQKRIKELEHFLGNSKVREEVLTAQVTDLEEKVASLQKQLGSQIQQVLQVRFQNNTVKGLYEKQKRTASQLNTKNDELVTQLDAQTKKSLETMILSATMKASNKNLTTQKKKLMEELAQVKEQVVKLDVKYDDLKLAYDQRVAMNDQELYTRCQLYSLMTEICGGKQQIEKRLQMSLKQIQDLQMTQNHLENRLLAVQRDELELKHAKNEQQQELDQVYNDRRRFEEDLTEQIKMYEKLEANYRGYEIMATEKINSLNEIIASLKEKLGIAEKNFADTQRERNDATHRVGELERVRKLEETESSTLNMQLYDVREDNKIKDNLLVTRKGINDSLKERIAILEKSLEEQQEHYEAKIANLKHDLNLVSMASEDHRSGQHKFEQLHANLDADFTVLSRKYISYVIHKGWMQQRVELQQAQIKENRLMLDNQRLALHKNQEDLKLLKGYKEQAEKEIEELNLQLHEKGIQLKIAESTINTLKDQLESVSNKLSRMEEAEAYRIQNRVEAEVQCRQYIFRREMGLEKDEFMQTVHIDDKSVEIMYYLVEKKARTQKEEEATRRPMNPAEDFDRDQYRLVFYRREGRGLGENYTHFVKCNRHGELMRDKVAKYWGRLRRFGFVIGKLLASERIGREKRLSAEERKKQAELLKEKLMEKAKNAFTQKKEEIEAQLKRDQEFMEQLAKTIDERVEAHEKVMQRDELKQHLDSKKDDMLKELQEGGEVLAVVEKFINQFLAKDDFESENFSEPQLKRGDGTAVQSEASHDSSALLFQKMETILDPIQTSSTKMHKTLMRFLGSLSVDILFNRLSEETMDELMARYFDEQIADLAKKMRTTNFKDLKQDLIVQEHKLISLFQQLIVRQDLKDIIKLQLFPATETNIKRKFSLRRTADVIEQKMKAHTFIEQLSHLTVREQNEYKRQLESIFPDKGIMSGDEEEPMGAKSTSVASDMDHSVPQSEMTLGQEANASKPDLNDQDKAQTMKLDRHGTKRTDFVIRRKVNGRSHNKSAFGPEHDTKMLDEADEGSKSEIEVKPHTIESLNSQEERPTSQIDILKSSQGHRTHFTSSVKSIFKENARKTLPGWVATKPKQIFGQTRKSLDQAKISLAIQQRHSHESSTESPYLPLMQSRFGGSTTDRDPRAINFEKNRSVSSRILGGRPKIMYKHSKMSKDSLSNIKLRTVTMSKADLGKQNRQSEFEPMFKQKQNLDNTRETVDEVITESLDNGSHMNMTQEKALSTNQKNDLIEKEIMNLILPNTQYLSSKMKQHAVKRKQREIKNLIRLAELKK